MSTTKFTRMRRLMDKIKTAGEDERYKLLSDLHKELGGKPWDWPPDLNEVEAQLKRR